MSSPELETAVRCLFCSMCLETDADPSPTNENPKWVGKNTAILRYHLKIKFRITTRQYRLPLCGICSKSAKDIIGLHEKIQALKADLRNLVDNAKKFMRRSNKETSASDSSSLSGEDEPVNVTRHRLKVISKRRILSSSDSESENRPEPGFANDESAQYVLPVDVEVQIKEEPESENEAAMEKEILNEQCEDVEKESRGGSSSNSKDSSSSHSSSSSSVSGSDSDSDSDGSTSEKEKETEKRKNAKPIKPFFDKLPNGRMMHGEFEVVKLGGGIVECVTCGTTLKQGTDIRVHVEEVHLGKKYCCEECGKVYTKREGFRKHKTFHKFAGKVFPCKICGKPSKTPRADKEHSWSHMNQEEIDRAIFEGKGHPPKKNCVHPPHPCRYCGKLISKASLPIHERLHEQGSEKPFLCSKCPSRFKNERDLRGHAHRIHPAITDRFQCTICSRTFAHQFQLGNHTALFHSEERPFKCSICEKGFKLPSRLANHAVTHTEDRPYKCDTCSNTYRFATGLQRHKREGCPSKRSYKRRKQEQPKFSG